MVYSVGPPFGAETKMALMRMIVASLLLSISIISESSTADASILCRFLRPWNPFNNKYLSQPADADASFFYDSQPDPNATTREPLPSNHTNNETIPPAPSNHSLSPTPAWDGHNGTQAPHNSTTEAPTPTNHTLAPSPSNHTGNYTTISPTVAPSFAPHHQNQSNVSTAAPSAAPDDDVVPKMTFLGIVRKTVAWLIIIALGVLAFGACMSHRYRIYFFLRGVWYTILRMRCTQWVFRKLRVFGSDQQVDSGLNTIIFDSEMSDGLLLNENNRDE